MKGAKHLICITCPKGCEAAVWAEEGEVKLKGKICKKGKRYLEQEFREPRMDRLRFTARLLRCRILLRCVRATASARR